MPAFTPFAYIHRLPPSQPPYTYVCPQREDNSFPNLEKKMGTTSLTPPNQKEKTSLYLNKFLILMANGELRSSTLTSVSFSWFFFFQNLIRCNSRKHVSPSVIKGATLAPPIGANCQGKNELCILNQNAHSESFQPSLWQIPNRYELSL